MSHLIPFNVTTGNLNMTCLMWLIVELMQRSSQNQAYFCTLHSLGKGA